MNDTPILRITPKGRHLLLLGVLLPLVCIGFLVGARGTWYVGDGINMQAARVTNVINPTALTDAANRNYTDNTSKVTYQGLTGTTYKGGMGGLPGVNARCNAAFAGSHICTVNEMMRSVTVSVSNGWVACEILYGDTCYTPMGTLTSGGTLYGSCAGYTVNTTTEAGFTFSGASALGTNSCNTALGIHCCK